MSIDRTSPVRSVRISFIISPFTISQTKETGKGTGLGLSTVFGIVHQHQGHVQVESEPGGGSLFRLLLPAAEDEALAEPRKVSDTTSSLNGTERILLVEAERLTGENPALQVVYMSGYTSEEINIQQLRDRGHGFVQKPFGAESLVRKIRELCDRTPEL